MGDLNRVINKVSSTDGVLYILCGYPYAGKSHIARQILQRTDAILVSIDDIFHSHGFDWNADRLPDAKGWGAIFDELYARTKEELKNGKNVLYDSTNQTLASREVLRAIAKSVNAEAYVILIKSSESAVWQRWEESTRDTSRHVVSRELIEKTIAEFEEPTEHEQVLIINN